MKVIIWQPQSIDFDLVVFLTTLSDGWPTLINNYFSVYGRETFSATFSDDQSKYPLYNFEYRSGEKNRIIQAIKDDPKWEFF